MSIYQTQFFNELEGGHDGPPIPVAKRAYFQERLRGIVFDFIINKFLREQDNGLTKAKLARRIGRAPEIINRLLGAPSNITLDTVSDLLIGISAEELVPQSKSLLRREPVNYSHADDLAEMLAGVERPKASARDTMFSGRSGGLSAKRIPEQTEQNNQMSSALCA
jgi:hypothetical protein